MKRCIPMSTLLIFSAVNALAQTTPGNVVQYHATINDVKYVYASVAPVARLKPGRHSRHQYARLFRQCHQEAGGHAQHDQGRQSADRAFLY